MDLFVFSTAVWLLDAKIPAKFSPASKTLNADDMEPFNCA